VSDDRGTWKLVARRDFWVRLRDRGFLISTAITLVILCVLIVIRANSGIGRPSFDLGMVASAVPPESVERLASTQGVTVHARTFSDSASAEAALRAGDLDAVLEEGDRTLVGLHGAAPEPLLQVVQAAVVSHRLSDVLGDAGLSPEELAGLQEQLRVIALDPGDPNADDNGRVAIVMVLLLYGQLFGYGIWVASGVIEEKSSRVVEILLSTIRPRQLLAGKIFGIGALGLLQLAVIGVVAATLASATGVLEIPGHAFATIGVALVWFVFGFGFYASLFAVAGALVSRMEELQNAIVPINLTILGSFFVSIAAVDDPNTTLAKGASLVPFSSALAMPVRIAVGSAPLWQAALSLAILAGSIAVLVPFAGRLYSGAVLRLGARVKLRDAWRAAS
jgi:ABC-2 type transport system permease protein